jgi:inhibitor of KinA sporulation pathway (predicted exonuclease)
MTDQKRILIIVDLEATCDEVETDAIRGPNREIIEIGAVKFDLDSGKEIDSFQAFVRPVINPLLSPFCRKLLNITQEDVEGAETFPFVHKTFLDWTDTVITAWGSWGEFDAYQWGHDATRYSLPVELPWPHLNLKTLFAKAMGLKRRGMGGAFLELGLEMKGERHRALPDVRHVIRLLNASPIYLSHLKTACDSLSEIQDTNLP